jgi:hypothetical protein
LEKIYLRPGEVVKERIGEALVEVAAEQDPLHIHEG